MEKTPLQQVKQMLENDVTPKAILSWIESTGEAVERDAIVKAVQLIGFTIGIITS